MLYCTFQHKLKRLNPRLRIYGDDAAPSRPWGLYLANPSGTGIEHICGVSKTGGMVYEMTERRWDGYILRQGWRRILTILLKKGVVDRRKTETEFGTSFEKARDRAVVVGKDPLTLAMEEARRRGEARTGFENYVEVDDLVDIHRWREKLRKDKTNYWA